ncbi:hypothetical protein GFER_08165 [Geoalkalibacter ferrihydriticus DSM 17813]|uniref:6-carboxyhexanoate--CoA ligase n=2 Tax=Geoalkalibacter ferrihydriticus TaxID=392333 RepID=A0A0C2HWM3_9BACT|nr:hypothetical protein GFER_08165 [Geoalkalibacter ferrihydriticus DSM 17813]
MHATREGAHLSGGERLVPAGEVEQAAAMLVRRALAHPRGRAQTLRLAVDLVGAAQVVRGRLPDVRTVCVADFHAGRDLAIELLQRSGVSEAAARGALAQLVRGGAPEGKSMRGAMLVGARDGRRYEPDAGRGVRVTRMDLSAAAQARLRAGLAHYALDSIHVREALVLAAKVLAAPGMLAELCWSDDPDYTTGYVASPALGYVRISELKPRGDERGGRAFFVDEQAVHFSDLISFLEQQVFLVEEIGAIHPPQERI